MQSRVLRPAFESLEDRSVPTYLGNQLFPLDNPWNQRIDQAPIAGNSDSIIARIINRHSGTAPALHADFGNPVTDGALYGIPVNVVDGTVTPFVTVNVPNFGYPGESDLVPVPIPANAVLEGDGPTGPAPPEDRGDSHLIVYDRTANIAYELFCAARPTETTFPYGGTKPLGQWGAYQISVWNLNTNSFRTLGFTSADAAGLPILTGLLRPDEANPPTSGGAGVIDHAIRVTFRQTRDSYVFPASHVASLLSDLDLPRMGERFRLKSSFVIPSTWSPEAKAIAQAMKDYGLIVADNGSDFFFQGLPSDQWNMDAVRQVQSIRGDLFEVVDLTPVVDSLSVVSGPTAGGTSVTVYGHNFSGAAGYLSVQFGTTPAASVTILSDSQVVALSPAHASGTVSVQVISGTTLTNGDGQSEFFGYGASATTAGSRFNFSDTGEPPSPLPPPPPGSPPPPPGSPPVSPPPPGSVGVSAGLLGSRQFAAGAGEQGGVRLFGPDGGPLASLSPFPGFAGGVRTAVADVTGDGVADLVVGTGPGIAARIKIYDGSNLTEVFSSSVYDGFTGGVFVAAGDLTDDGTADVILTPDQGGGPRVLVLRGGDFQQIASIFGIDDPNFRGGARAASGDISGDGRDDLVVAVGFGGGPRVAAYDGRSVVSGNLVRLFNDMFVFDPDLRNGVYAAVGDIDGDGFADLIAGAGPGGGPQVLALSGRDLMDGLSNGSRKLTNFFGGNPENRGGIRVAAKNLDGDARADIVVGDGEGGGSRVTAYAGKDFAAGSAPELFRIDPFPGFTSGVFVG